jgi:hypothetical protein
VVAGDLIAVINSFLGGELTVRFVLKALTVLVIAGGIFGFYLSDIRNKVTARGRGIVAGGSLVVIVLSLVCGFVVLGSPFTVRLDRFDDQKVSHLQEIQWQVVYFWQAKQKLPATLSELTDTISGFKAPVDPQDGSSYEYVVKGPTSFTLCAQFNRESIIDRGTPYPTTKPITIDEEITHWSHKAGRVCFDKTIDPEKYPPLTPAKPR